MFPKKYDSANSARPSPAEDCDPIVLTCDQIEEKQSAESHREKDTVEMERELSLARSQRVGTSPEALSPSESTRWEICVCS